MKFPGTSTVLFVMAAGIAGAAHAVQATAAAAENLPRHAVLGAGVLDKDGVRINFIRPGSAADRAGLRLDDIVLAIGGHAVAASAEFVADVRSQAVGKPVDVSIRRGSLPLTVPVILDAAPDEHDAFVATLYQSINVGGTLRRTLVTVPKGARGPHPALLILGGIGCFTVDNAVDPQDAYMRLAHDLGRSGIVVMRVEKSGIGDSRGPLCAGVDLVGEMQLYRTALDSLRRDAHVDGGRVYLFGHSIGTLIAPRIANDGGAVGVVIADGVGRNWVEYELANLRRQLELEGDAPARVDAVLAVKEFCMHRLLVEKQTEAEIESVRPECKEQNDYPVSALYMQQAAALNIAAPWTKFSGPLLAIYGSADFVTAEEDHRRIVDIVNAAHPGTATLKIVSGMDHHLDVAGTPQQAYDLRVKRKGAGPYDEELSKTVRDWLCAREKCAAAG